MWDAAVLLLQLGSFAVLVYGGIIAIGFAHLRRESRPSTVDEFKAMDGDNSQSPSRAPTTATSAPRAERRATRRFKRAA